MSTRQSNRPAKPSVKALESSSVSPPATRTPRSSNIRAPKGAQDTDNDEDTEVNGGAQDESPVAKRRKLSPETQRAPSSVGRPSAKKKQPPAKEKAAEEETPKPTPARQPVRRRVALAKPGEDSAAPPQFKLSTPQKITNLYAGKGKHADRDDTPSTVASFREISPVKSARKDLQTVTVVVTEEGVSGGVVDKFRRGRHGSAKKKGAGVTASPAMKPTIVVNGVAQDEAAQATPSKRRGRKPKKVDDTDLEGDVIMADSDASPTRRGSPTKLAAPKSVGRKKRVEKTPVKNDDDSSIYDFPASDEEEEDPFQEKVKSIKKAPSRFTASLRRAAVAAQDGEVSSSSKGNEAEDEKDADGEVALEEDDEIAELLQVKKQTKALTTFTGTVTEEAVEYLKQTVMKKITGRGLPDKLIGLKDEFNNVLQLLEQTVVAGEGNSILLIGPRGSGKSLVVEKAINELKKHHEKDFIVVRLSGCLQTDERTAVREIWRQLGSSMDLDESKPINFADTLTTILALLSHPSEHDPNASQEAMAETTSISVLFLLSEFEQFAAHPRQTLLYNLFDIAQARKAPIAVVGMTSKINIVEDLEKRVKSRFSHRTLGFRTGGNLGSRLEGWWEIAKSGLSVDIEALLDFDKDQLAYYTQWNASLDDAFINDKTFRRTVETVYSTSKNIQVLYNHFILSICNVTVEAPFLGNGAALLKNSLVAPDNKLYLLEDLPELSLAMLISAARLDPILETDTCNFTMAYDEYKTLVSRVKIYSQTTWGMKLWGKDVALAAWERLAEWELIVPVVGAAAYGGGIGVTASLLVGSGSSGVGRRESRMFRVDVGLLEIKRQGRSWGMSSVLQGWCTI
ncbi:hypothetical protein H072_3348 [Dactylellina haptotyla CBS 200.50]|uniref:Origin recognition complex subunit 4 n=1 Tax=Dactylellina haptotyla (strain CBS 200.50) TaxID=1284197 RepID=S8AII1_DACHA|nr:hypothetical protein H072_3348 [Dactylellina haptotyla CBS 200.50]